MTKKQQEDEAKFPSVWLQDGAFWWACVRSELTFITHGPFETKNKAIENINSVFLLRLRKIPFILNGRPKYVPNGAIWSKAIANRSWYEQI